MYKKQQQRITTVTDVRKYFPGEVFMSPPLTPSTIRPNSRIKTLQIIQKNNTTLNKFDLMEKLTSTQNASFLIAFLACCFLALVPNVTWGQANCPTTITCADDGGGSIITITFLNNSDALAASTAVPSFTLGQGGSAQTYISPSVTGSVLTYADNEPCYEIDDITNPGNTQFPSWQVFNLFSDPCAVGTCNVTNGGGSGGSACNPENTYINCSWLETNVNASGCSLDIPTTNGCGLSGYKCADIIFDINDIINCSAYADPGLAGCLAADPNIVPLITFEITQGNGCNASANNPNVYNESCQPQFGGTVTIDPITGTVNAMLPAVNSGTASFIVCSSSGNLSISNFSVSSAGACCPDPTAPIGVTQN